MFRRCVCVCVFFFFNKSADPCAPTPSFSFRNPFPGLSSLLNNPAAKTPTNSNSEKQSLTTPLTAESHTPPKVIPSPTSVPLTRDPTSQGYVAPSTLQSNMVNEKVNPGSSLNPTLDSKIDTFLQVHPGLKGFNLGFPSVLPWPKGTVDSPSASAENLGGTPVRDEAGATPTQDEIMDDPRSEPFPYQQGQTSSTDSKLTSQLPSWQEQIAHADAQAPEIHQMIAPLKDSVPSLADAESQRHHRMEAMRSSLMSSNQQPSRESREATEGSSMLLQDVRQNPLIRNVGPNPKLVEGSYGYQDGQKRQVLASSDTYGGDPYLSKEQRPNLTAPTFFTTPLPPIPKLPPPPKDFIAPASSLRANAPHSTRNLPGSFSDAEQRGGVNNSYVPTKSDYEQMSHEVPKEEPFHPHGDRVAHSAHAPHHASKIPPNGPMDYNHQHPPRAPLQHPPSIPHHHIGGPPPVMSYHEAQSPPRPLPKDPYTDTYYDHPQRSPSSPHYDMHSVSPRSQEYYPEELAPHYPEHRVPPHMEHRPPPPHHVRPPHPGHYPPPRPIRRPPPVHHEPPFARGKRPGPPFGGPPRVRGPFYPPKRPFLPPHY